jgi:formaldehyde-activating enzyme involved in methanogenesis
MEATGKTVEALAARRSDELAALDESLRSTQLAIWAAQDLSEAQTNATQAAEEAQAAAKAAQDESIRLQQEAISRAMATLSASVGKERDRITKIYNTNIESTNKAISALSDSVAKLKSLSDALKNTLEKMWANGTAPWKKWD